MLGPAQATGSALNGEYVISITQGGDFPWDVNLKQENLPIEGGKTYQVSFDADAPRQISALVGKYSDPWTVYSGSHVFALNTATRNYSFSFPMRDATDPVSRLAFDIGLSTAGVYFDNLSLTEDALPAGTTSW